MEYGGIAINTMPPFIFLSPYLIWGGNEEGKTFVSGLGNFGNLLNYENVEKSIIEANFTSAGHMMNTNKAANDALSRNMAHFAMAPTWMNLTRLMAGAVTGSFRHKDFQRIKALIYWGASRISQRRPACWAGVGNLEISSKCNLPKNIRSSSPAEIPGEVLS
jgi:hypothetical protein